ncbi:CPBP family intramembrane metalloprotease domain-containing protein [Arthrobacter sp. MYb224]|uniref:CPBP family intramembrane glutamic endopeptidase n=1 Tax=Micrococcaceae TaxID=1268 RepID=UPI000CFB835A|nr:MULTISPECIES: CPBP family intramembrane glutamic endopeptidase [unclassified Arthrobacter]PQZ99681.1 CPBP family intramembrane metalloprotease domain-containing protein [Arthrobacter sp. MYb224]PRA05852.1 CPBP family intramembrane metalloprotease domain-containing protein [Arthrobacter sp. MYb229]PRB52753.1 CPBP family intramembrane metalloprotease domain-containing protein [Arthrobacter sp. MYb216]
MSKPEINGPTPNAASADEPRYEFHRLMRRDPKYAWWRPLALLGTATGFYLVAIVILLIGLMIVLFSSLGTRLDEPTDPVMMAFDSMNMADPAVFLFTMLSLIVLIPVAYFAYLLLGPKPLGLLISVAGRIRWKWLGLCTGIAVVLYAIYFGISLGIEAAGLVAPTNVPAENLPANPLFFALLVVLLVPFQAAAEEIVFRGMLMQTIGSWLKHPLFAILLPVPLFTFGHLYDIYGLLDVAFFAIAAGFLTWRTGGLEAAIAIHVINNVGLFLLAAVGAVDINATQSSLSSLLTSIGFTALVTYILLWVAKRRHIERTAGPAPQRRAPQLLQPWPAAYPAVPPAPAYWAPPAPQSGSAYPPAQPPLEGYPNPSQPDANPHDHNAPNP